MTDALDRIFAQVAPVQRKRRVLNFVQRQLHNPRPAVRKKADRFLRTHAAGKSAPRAAQ